MPAMRLYTPKELEALLRGLGCIKTEDKSKTTVFWYTKRQVMFSVPAPDALSGKYSDFIVYMLRDFAEAN